MNCILSSRRRQTKYISVTSSDVCSSDLSSDNGPRIITIANCFLKERSTLEEIDLGMLRDKMLKERTRNQEGEPNASGKETEMI